MYHNKGNSGDTLSASALHGKTVCGRTRCVPTICQIVAVAVCETITAAAVVRQPYNATNHDENGIHTFTLAPGLYFVKSGEGAVKKVVVE